MTQRDSSPGPEGPKPIRRLDQSLVNRIAAGEVCCYQVHSLNRGLLSINEDHPSPLFCFERAPRELT